MLSKIDIGKGVGRWKTMPTRERSAVTSIDGSSTSIPESLIDPSARCSGYRSCMRLRDLRSVDFPHPEGPMKAVTHPSGIFIDTFLSAWKFP